MRKETAISLLPDSSDATPASGDDPGRDLCDRFAEMLPVAGASISVVTERGSHSIIGASDGLAALLEARQFELGIGPHWEALRTERPAMHYRFIDSAATPFWSQLETDGNLGAAAALFAFPLRLGEATVGVADLYSLSTVEPWSDEMIDRARGVARSVTSAAVSLAMRSASTASSTAGRSAVELRREVHQATGMVMGQLGCSASTALVRLRAHAFASDVPLDTLAREVIARRVDFAEL